MVIEMVKELKLGGTKYYPNILLRRIGGRTELRKRGLSGAWLPPRFLGKK
jgi:hypothetical protein